METTTATWQTKPAVLAIAVERAFDAVLVLGVLLVLTLPLYLLFKSLGPILMLIALTGLVLVFLRLVYDLVAREGTSYLLEPESLVVQSGVLDSRQVRVPLEGLEPTAVRVHQSLQGQVGGYASLIVLTPNGQKLELKYLEDAAAWRQEMLKRIGAADAPPERPVWFSDAPSEPGWLGGLSYVIVGLTIVLILLGGFLLLSRMRFAAPGVPAVTVTLPMPYGDASISLQDLLSYLFQMRSFTFTLTLLFLVIITRIAATLALRRR